MQIWDSWLNHFHLVILGPWLLLFSPLGPYFFLSVTLGVCLGFPYVNPFSFSWYVAVWSQTLTSTSAEVVFISFVVHILLPRQIAWSFPSMSSSELHLRFSSRTFPIFFLLGMTLWELAASFDTVCVELHFWRCFKKPFHYFSGQLPCWDYTPPPPPPTVSQVQQLVKVSKHSFNCIFRLVQVLIIEMFNSIIIICIFSLWLSASIITLSEINPNFFKDKPEGLAMTSHHHTPYVLGYM